MFADCFWSNVQCCWASTCIWFFLWDHTVPWTPRMFEFLSWFGSLCGLKICANGIALVCSWYHTLVHECCRVQYHACLVCNGGVISHAQYRVWEYMYVCSPQISLWRLQGVKLFQDAVRQFCHNEIPLNSAATFVRSWSLTCTVSIITTLRIARLALQTRKLWLVDVATIRKARDAVRFLLKNKKLKRNASKQTHKKNKMKRNVITKKQEKRKRKETQEKKNGEKWKKTIKIHWFFFFFGKMTKMKKWRKKNIRKNPTPK